MGDWEKENDMTKIPCTRETRSILRSIGNKQETYDSVLNRLIKSYKEQED